MPHTESMVMIHHSSPLSCPATQWSEIIWSYILVNRLWGHSDIPQASQWYDSHLMKLSLGFQCIASQTIALIMALWPSCQLWRKCHIQMANLFPEPCTMPNMAPSISPRMSIERWLVVLGPTLNRQLWETWPSNHGMLPLLGRPSSDFWPLAHSSTDF